MLPATLAHLTGLSPLISFKVLYPVITALLPGIGIPRVGAIPLAALRGTRRRPDHRPELLLPAAARVGAPGDRAPVLRRPGGRTPGRAAGPTVASWPDRPGLARVGGLALLEHVPGDPVGADRDRAVCPPPARCTHPGSVAGAGGRRDIADRRRGGVGRRDHPLDEQPHVVLGVDRGQGTEPAAHPAWRPRHNVPQWKRAPGRERPGLRAGRGQRLSRQTALHPSPAGGQSGALPASNRASSPRPRSEAPPCPT